LSAAYINRIAAVLPNAPVSNDRMEAVLGLIDGRPSRARSVVLRSNGIRNRHYVLEGEGPGGGRVTMNNAQLTAQAVRGLAGDGFGLDQIEVLACGTASPDQMIPGHGVMVHGELGSAPCEVMSAAGVCISGVLALKYAFLSVASGQAHNAVATGSETASLFLRAMNFAGASGGEADKRQAVAFDKDFLRWMLSDGAGAMLLQNRPNPSGLSLRLDWIDQFSYANDFEVCMYCGGEKTAAGGFRGWREYASMQEVVGSSALAVRQDLRLLDSGIRECSRRAFRDMLARRSLPLDQVDWFLPHYSSEYFRPVLHEVMPDDWKIPYSRWFTNLREKGNVGAASIYLMLDELFNSGRLLPGQRLLCFVPESGRFSAAFFHLTVVAGS
jgi:3-oxoacyl-[acyl-carrier-protein] synthase-3